MNSRTRTFGAEVHKSNIRVTRWHNKYKILNCIERHNFCLSDLLTNSNRTTLQSYKVEERTFGTPCIDCRPPSAVRRPAPRRPTLNNTDNVFLVSHENLKEKRCLYDNKHFSRTVGMPKLASNLIRGIRLARVHWNLVSFRKKPKAKASAKESHRDVANKSEKPINSQEFPPNHEININIIKEVLQQLKVNGSILSGLASSRQYVQGLETPAFPQTVYLIRQAMSPVY